MKLLRRITVYILLLSLIIQPSRAQMPTIDATNLAQAILSFIQDGDNMAASTAQFLRNLGVMEEQLSLLQEMRDRYSTVRSAIYKGREVLYIASTYERTLSMFSDYVDRIRKEGSDGRIPVDEVRLLVRQGTQYLVLVSREVARAREYLSATSSLDEGSRRAGLEKCEDSITRAYSSLRTHIERTYEDMDRAKILEVNLSFLESSFTPVY